MMSFKRNESLRLPTNREKQAFRKNCEKLISNGIGRIALSPVMTVEPLYSEINDSYAIAREQQFWNIARQRFIFTKIVGVDGGLNTFKDIYHYGDVGQYNPDILSETVVPSKPTPPELAETIDAESHTLVDGYYHVSAAELEVYTNLSEGLYNRYVLGRDS